MGSKTMITRSLMAILILASTTSSIWAGESESDFDLVCQYFSTLESRPDLESLSSIERSKFITQKIQNTLPDTSDARVAWDAISHATPDVRYDLYQTAAESSGLKNWTCPSMETLAPVTGAF